VRDGAELTCTCGNCYENCYDAILWSWPRVILVRLLKGPPMILAAQSSAVSNVEGAVAAIAVIAAYWAPSIVALARKVPNRGSVAVVNAFLGWTVIGWIVALAMACRSVPHASPPVA
jgi:hypothetical protein